MSFDLFPGRGLSAVVRRINLDKPQQPIRTKIPGYFFELYPPAAGFFLAAREHPDMSWIERLLLHSCMEAHGDKSREQPSRSAFDVRSGALRRSACFVPVKSRDAEFLRIIKRDRAPIPHLSFLSLLARSSDDDALCLLSPLENFFPVYRSLDTRSVSMMMTVFSVSLLRISSYLLPTRVLLYTCSVSRFEEVFWNER